MTLWHRTRGWVRLWSLVGLMIMLLGGCGSTPAAVPEEIVAAAPLPADWQQVELRELSLALPPEWVQTSAEDVDVSQAVTEMAAQNPRMQELLTQGQVQLNSGQVQLIAYDVAPERVGATGFPTSLRVGQQTFGDAPSLDAVSAANEQQLRASAGFKDIERTAVLLGGLTATRLRSTLDITDPLGEPLQLALEQYLLLQDKQLQVLTLTTPASQQQLYRPIFDQILATLQLTPTP